MLISCLSLHVLIPYISKAASYSQRRRHLTASGCSDKGSGAEAFSGCRIQESISVARVWLNGLRAPFYLSFTCRRQMSFHKANSTTDTAPRRASMRRPRSERHLGAHGGRGEAPAAARDGEKLTFAFLLVSVRESLPGAPGMGSFPRGGGIP